jgi:hypothetical protein
MAALRPPEGTVLVVLRAAVLALGGAGVVVGVLALVLGAGGGEPRIDDLGAQVVLGAATITAAIGIAVVGRSWEPPPSELAMASSLFTLTLRRVIVASMVLPVGMVLSWASGDETWIVFGAGATLLLMAVAGPTVDRIEKWQAEADEAGVDVSVLGALSRRYR